MNFGTSQDVEKRSGNRCPASRAGQGVRPAAAGSYPMKNSFTTEQLDLFASANGRDLADAVASGDPLAFATRVPSTWLDLVARPDTSAIRAVWEPATAHLPRFVDYLARSISGAAIIEVRTFPVLLLALPNWNEENFELVPGFCWMGLPATSAQIEHLVADVGSIPPSLEQLWRVANFITIKDGSILCSPDPTTRPMTEAPVVLSALADPNVTEDIYECLQIAVVNNPMVTCMTRPPGQSHWNDFLVLRFRRTHDLSSAVRTRLDDKLADWTFVDWTP